MKVAVYPGDGQPMRIETRDMPVAGPDDLLIKVHRCGICGTDLHMTSGHGWDYRPGAVPGHEYAGEIIEIGEAVEGFAKGDLIAYRLTVGCGKCEACRVGNAALCRGMQSGMGGFAECHRLAAANAVKLPATYSATDGALIEPFAVGLHGVRMAEMKPGDRVLILGAGTVALTTLYWARRLGAGQIVVASRSDWREEMARAMGADAYIRTGEADEAQRVAAALGGEPDIVFECAGAPGLLGQAIDHVRVLGHVVSLGFCRSPDPVIPGIAGFKGVRLCFPMGYSAKDFQFAADALLSGHADPKTIVSNVIPLEALPQTFEMLRGANQETKVHVSPLLPDTAKQA
jgi:(R,R)-butanediol dehydrogenase/meso-butanediol dehydrogenase/diacetyl reductase